MRSVGIAVVLSLAACGEDGPPSLPGAEDPPCQLASPHHYLITSLSTKDSDAVDLSVPPDGRPDNLEYPDTYIEAAAGSPLTDALMRALATHRVAWVITTQVCNDDSRYVRVALRQAQSVAATSPLPTVTLAPDAPMWSVGTFSGGTIEASQGIAVVPVAAPIDVQADTVEPAWFPFYEVTLHLTASGSRLAGSVAGAIDTASAAPAIADAIARTLTAAHEANPACPPTCDQPALADVIHVVDSNGDLQFSGAEVLASGGLAVLGYYPDLDLLADDHGHPVFWPAHDHDVESLGHGYVIEADEVTAQ